MAGLKQKQILDEANAWIYLFWDRATQCFHLTKQEPLPSTKLKEIMVKLFQLATQGILIHRFSALKPMHKDHILEDAQITIPWRLDISIRSEIAQQLLEILRTVSGNRIDQPILMRFRPTDLQRSSFATAIAHRVRR